MPEIAEVRLMADNMAHFLVGKTLLQLRITDPIKFAKWANRCAANLPALNAHLDGCNGIVVKAVHTRGKFSWLECEGDLCIGIHFGMSGNIRPEPTPEFLSTYRWRGKPITREEYLKHCLVALEYLEGEQKKSQIYFHDLRRFGRFDVFWTKAELDQKLQKLGHDPLSQPRLSDSEILKAFRRHDRKNICKTLMCQELLAGVGNYIKSETLYVAGISPYASVYQIPDVVLLKLYQAVRDLSRKAYEAGGATLYTYTGIQGDQTDFKGTLNIYGKGGELDPLGHTIMRIGDKQSPDRRTTFWVPEVQTVGSVPSASGPSGSSGPSGPSGPSGSSGPKGKEAVETTTVKGGPVSVTIKPIHPPPKLRLKQGFKTGFKTEFKTQKDGTRSMPEGYQAGEPGYRDCCNSSLCSLGSECKASVERLVDCGIIREKD